jgi:hypothetical protein
MEAFRNVTPRLEGRGLPGPLDLAQIPALAERGRARIAQFFKTIDGRLADREFVAGSRYSIADITTLVTVDFAGWVKLTIPDDCPHLRRWHAAARAPERPRISPPLPAPTGTSCCVAPKCVAPASADISFPSSRRPRNGLSIQAVSIADRAAAHISVCGQPASGGNAAVGANCAEEARAMALRPVTLDDKYDLTKSPVFVTGFQALVRLTLMQKERDRRAGLHTAGYVSGYRGSPLGLLDQQFQRAQAHLDRADIRFQPGINEDMAATAIWGTQQAELRGEGKYDGVFGLWYGKGPGVDRTGDVFRHANFAGTSKHGGVLALMGDDHTAESSTTAHQSEYHFIDVMIPILNPAGAQEFLDYGLYGWAMSRFTGAWVALKCMHETVESTAVVDGSLDRVKIIIPDDFNMPEGGLNIRLGDSILGMEARLHDYKRDAMLAFVRANKLNRYITSGGRNPKIGIITVGKSYLDVRQAFDELGIDEVKCNDLGIRLYKVACAGRSPSAS